MKKYDYIDTLKHAYKEIGDCFLCEHKEINGMRDYLGNFVCMWCWDSGEADEKGYHMENPEKWRVFDSLCEEWDPFDGNQDEVKYLFSNVTYKKFVEKVLSFKTNTEEIYKFKDRCRKSIKRSVVSFQSVYESKMKLHKESGKQSYLYDAIKEAEFYLNYANLSIVFLDEIPEKYQEIKDFLKENKNGSNT